MADPKSGFTGPPADRRKYLVTDITSFRRGGIGVVFEGRTQPVDGSGESTDVGLKMLTAIDKERFAKLVERSSILSTLSHPNLARHIECFVGPAPSDGPVDEDESDQFFSVHEWVTGTPLSALIAEANPADVLSWGRDIAAGIDFLHNASGGGFAHRDIHARNIIIRDDNTAVLIDYDTILWGESDDTNIASLSSLGSDLAREPGLVGAQSEDIRALAATLLRAFAHDSESALTLEQLSQTAADNLQQVAKDPHGVVQRLNELVRAPRLSASDVVRDVETRFENRPPRFRPPGRKTIGWSIAAIAIAAALVFGFTQWPTDDPTASSQLKSTGECLGVSAETLTVAINRHLPTHARAVHLGKTSTTCTFNGISIAKNTQASTLRKAVDTPSKLTQPTELLIPALVGSTTAKKGEACGFGGFPVHGGAITVRVLCKAGDSASKVRSGVVDVLATLSAKHGDDLTAATDGREGVVVGDLPTVKDVRQIYGSSAIAARFVEATDGGAYGARCYAADVPGVLPASARYADYIDSGASPLYGNEHQNPTVEVAQFDDADQNAAALAIATAECGKQSRRVNWTEIPVKPPFIAFRGIHDGVNGIEILAMKGRYLMTVDVGTHTGVPNFASALDLARTTYRGIADDVIVAASRAKSAASKPIDFTDGGAQSGAFVSADEFTNEERLSRTSPSFRKFAQEQLVHQTEQDKDTDCNVKLVVKKYSAHGYASVTRSEDGPSDLTAGSFACSFEGTDLWVEGPSGWKSVWEGRDPAQFPPCTTLHTFAIPSVFAGDWCLKDEARREGEDYNF